jgi:hypothetical protein
MVSAAIAVSVWVISALLVGYSIYRNFKDAHRAESLRAEIVTIKDENKVQLAAEYERGRKEGLKSPKGRQQTAPDEDSRYEAPISESELPTFQNTRKHFTELSFSQRWALKKVLQSPGQRYPDLLASLGAMGFAHPDLDVGQLFFRNLAEEQIGGSIAPSVWVVKFQDRLFKEFPLDPDSRNQAFQLVEPVPRLVIQKALYGPENRLGFEDVTHIVRAHLHNNAIDMEVSDKTFPEFPPHSRIMAMPLPSKYLLEVTYTMGDLKDQVIVRYAGSRLVLPEAPVKPPASGAVAL